LAGLTEAKEDGTVNNVVDKHHLVLQKLVPWYTVNELRQQ